MRVLVVGAGIAGASTAVALARRGHTVIGAEQFDRGHAFGSSHGNSRIIRKTYPDRLHTGLMEKAYPLWDEVQTLAGQRWIERSGILVFGPAGHPDVQGLCDALDFHGVPWERCSSCDAPAQAGVHLWSDEIGIWQPDGGTILASQAVEGLLSLSQSLGAEWSFTNKIDCIERVGNRLVARGEAFEDVFDSAVLCTGPWVSRWWPEYRAHFTVTRQTWAYVGGLESAGPRTVWIDIGTLAYGFPPDGNVAGYKIARHVPGLVLNPDRVDREWNDSDRADLESIAGERLQLTEPLHGMGTCLYTNTPDALFAVGHGADPAILVVSPCSGHGFKFGPLIGEWAARAVENGGWPDETTPFSIDRFAS